MPLAHLRLINSIRKKAILIYWLTLMHQIQLKEVRN